MRIRDSRQGLYALTQVGSRRLPGGVARDVDEVVGELEDDADLLAEARECVEIRLPEPGDHAAEPCGRRDQRAGLVGDDRKMVLDRRGVARPEEFGDLSLYQPGERLGLDGHEVRT